MDTELLAQRPFLQTVLSDFDGVVTQLRDGISPQKNHSQHFGLCVGSIEAERISTLLPIQNPAWMANINLKQGLHFLLVSGDAGILHEPKAKQEYMWSARGVTIQERGVSF
ncbi:unnamed protein product [Boreogadus saida]